MRALLFALIALCLLLTGCGSDDETASETTGSAATGIEAGALPVTIKHRFGSTTVKEAPERIVVAGLREQDALLALGIVPVATTEWYVKHPGAIFP